CFPISVRIEIVYDMLEWERWMDMLDNFRLTEGEDKFIWNERVATKKKGSMLPFLKKQKVFWDQWNDYLF
ncbi:hypothetical protein ACJX0J_017209, partial [Zea mays]